MKKSFLFPSLAAAALCLSACEDTDDSTTGYDIPSAVEYNALHEAALESRTQHFTVDVATGWQQLTDVNGVVISFNPQCFTLDGVAVTGSVDIEFIALFDTADMVVTNRATMGRMANGDLSMLVSGGEFYVNATQNGQQLAATCNFALLIPTSLTGGNDPGMSLWQGIIDADGELTWEEPEVDPNGQGGGVFQEGNNYYLTFGNFGWTNVDRFYSDPRPKTTLLVDVPEGYDNDNSSVYLSYDGEGNALARLDTFTAEGYFSEHYGQIPIGLECHVIFVTEEDGGYRYAIKAATIVADGIITFTYAETTTGTEAQLVAAIEAVQD